MATYSRSQTTTQTTESQSVMPSMDLSSLIIRTMENTLKDNDNNDTGDKSFEESISNGINNSDLLKDKTKNDNDKELSDLLKDKKNSDKELSDLLKDTNKNAKDEKKKSTVKSSSDKASGAITKALTGGLIATTVGAIVKSKSLGQAASGIVGGTGKLAGGILSKTGDIGGAAIAGIGRLFGPIGAIIGKGVGTAVAVPFKVVGGIITKATGALGAMLSMPLKELVTKGALITGVLSQLFVFFEGLLAKFLRDKDLKTIEMMSKIHSIISIFPDRLMLSFEKLLSKVRIGGKPIFGGLSGEEKDEYEKLQKNKDVINYGNLTEVDIPEKEEQLQKLRATMMEEYNRATGGNLDLSKYNLNTTAGKESLKNDWLSQLPESERGAMLETINERLSDYSLMSSSLDDAKKQANYLANNDPTVKRFLELKDLNDAGKTQDYFDKREKELDEKQNQKFQENFVEGVTDYANEKGITDYQLYQQAESIGGAGTAEAIKNTFQGKYNKEITMRNSTGAERFLDNEYKAWIDSWKDMVQHLQQNIGIQIKQKQERPNPMADHSR